MRTITTGTSWVLRACVLASLTTLTLATGAVAVTGGPVTPQQSRAMLRATELSADYGHATAVTTEDLGKGRRPASCENPVDGRTAIPHAAAVRGLFKQIDFPAGLQWQNTVFSYPSAAQAATAWRELVKETLAYCDISRVFNIGTDEDVVMARVTLAARRLPTSEGVQRFDVRYSISLAEAQAPGSMYADSYDYSVYGFSATSITRVGVVHGVRLGSVEVNDAQTSVVKVAGRIARLGG